MLLWRIQYSPGDHSVRDVFYSSYFEQPYFANIVILFDLTKQFIQVQSELNTLESVTVVKMFKVMQDLLSNTQIDK